MVKRTEAALVVLAGAACWWLAPLSAWGEIAEGLLAFFGLLVAAIVQIIPVTTNFLQADNLTIDEAKRLSKALEDQQKYWVALLILSVAAAALIIAGKLIKPEIPNSIDFGMFSVALAIPFSSIASGMIGAAVCFALVRIYGIVPGVISLQKLRSDLVLNAAKRAQAKRVEEETEKLQPLPPIVNHDYGRVTHRQ